MISGYEYDALMSSLRVSVSKHLLDEFYTLIWANDYYYDLIGYTKEEYEEKYSRFCDLITVGESRPFRLWTMPADSLKRHPYIRNWKTANAIVLYRDNNPRELWTVEGLRNAGILDDAAAARLSRCRIE